MTATHITAPTQYIGVDGDQFAYRRWGVGPGAAVVLIQHVRGGMDHWDPLIPTTCPRIRASTLVRTQRGTGVGGGPADQIQAASCSALARSRPVARV